MLPIRKRVSVVVVYKDRILGFEAVDPTNHKQYVFLPGGVQEEGETLEDTGIRETYEETGYKIKIHPKPRLFRSYDFQWDGNRNQCETWYLAGSLESDQAAPVQDADYNKGVKWTPLSEIKSYFDYHPDVLQPLEEMIQVLQSSSPLNERKN